jgi:hypothetical protein
VTELAAPADNKELPMAENDLEERVRGLETAQATQAATQAGAEATQAATQAGTMSTMTAMNAGNLATMVSGSLGLIAGMFLGIALSRK